ncbi:MAG: hypothetical protein FWG57_08050 [Endomicrobia bacterium]|nr:hypothetical protein [Endomicrobiia bacterium]
MNKAFKIRIISYSILLSILLNISISSIILNNDNLDLSVTFSSIASTITYSYNPIQLTKELQDNLLGGLYKNTVKQNKKEEKRNTDEDKREFLFIDSLGRNAERSSVAAKSKHLSFDSRFFGGVYAAHSHSAQDNMLFRSASHQDIPAVFYLMLLAWLVIIFRKKRNVFTIFSNKNI